MELGQLKASWAELNNRLDKSEKLNNHAISTLLKKNALGSKQRIFRIEFQMMMACIIMVFLNSFFLYTMDSQTTVQPETVILVITVLFMAALWQGYKLYLLSKMNIETCTVIDLTEKITRYRLITRYRVVVGMALLIPIMGLIIYFQREFTSREILYAVGCGALVGVIIGFKIKAKLFGEINNFAGELREIKTYNVAFE